MFSERKTILFLGAHPDDIVLGAGATVAKLVKGHEVFCYTLSENIEQERQKDLPREDARAMRVLGVPKDNFKILDFRTRHFPTDRQKICDALWRIKKELNPSIIFTHSKNDIHQDHLVVAAETERVFRDKTVLCMEVARSQLGFFPQLFVKLESKDLDKKIKALKEYKTYKHLNYTNPAMVKAVAMARGAQFEKGHVEAFEILRYIIGQ